MSEQLEDLQAEIDADIAHQISDHLDCAESCETLDDFTDNVQNAIDAASTLIHELKTLQRKRKA